MSEPTMEQMLDALVKAMDEARYSSTAEDYRARDRAFDDIRARYAELERERDAYAERFKFLLREIRPVDFHFSVDGYVDMRDESECGKAIDEAIAKRSGGAESENSAR